MSDNSDLWRQRLAPCTYRRAFCILSNCTAPLIKAQLPLINKICLLANVMMRLSPS